MKSLSITLLFSAFSLFATAQTFNEKTFMDIMERSSKDHIQSAKTEIAPEFVFNGTNGHVFDLKSTIALYESATSVSRSFSNLKVRQYGNVGIATGSIKQNVTLKSGGILILNELFTYVFNEQNGKWLLVSAQHSEGTSDPKQDEADIKAVIEKETQAFLDRDAAAMLECHVNKPYSLLLVGEHGAVHYMTNPKSDMDKVYTEMMTQFGKPNGDTFKNKDYVIRINGNSAFAYFDQTGLNTTTAPNKDVEISHQTRYLEKVNGAWKIVYVGGLGAKP